VVIYTFEWNLPHSKAFITDGAAIAFTLLTSIASAASFFGIVMTMSENVA